MSESPAPPILSVRPKHVWNLFKGEKTIELRRRFTPMKFVDAFVYETAPRQAIVGVLHRIDAHSLPTSLIEERTHPLCLSRQEIQDYLQGLKRGFLIVFHDAVALSRPRPLRELRDLGFHPPQSWSYAKGLLRDLLEEEVRIIDQAWEEERLLRRGQASNQAEAQILSRTSEGRRILRSWREARRQERKHNDQAI